MTEEKNPPQPSPPAQPARLILDPQLKMLLTSVLLAVSSAAAGIGVTHGMIPAADRDAVSNIIATFVSGVALALFTYYTTRQSSQKAMINAVNASTTNGVKVVPETSMASAVNEPINPPPPPPPT